MRQTPKPSPVTVSRHDGANDSSTNRVPARGAIPGTVRGGPSVSRRVAPGGSSSRCRGNTSKGGTRSARLRTPPPRASAPAPEAGVPPACAPVASELSDPSAQRAPAFNLVLDFARPALHLRTEDNQRSQIDMVPVAGLTRLTERPLEPERAESRECAEMVADRVRRTGPSQACPAPASPAPSSAS